MTFRHRLVGPLCGITLYIPYELTSILWPHSHSFLWNYYTKSLSYRIKIHYAGIGIGVGLGLTVIKAVAMSRLSLLIPLSIHIVSPAIVLVM